MVTIRDVARAAGVSVATVSRVYNGSQLVREDTRSRVREAGSRLGYAPHGAARSLITSRTHTIGVLLPDLYGEFFSEVIRGIDLTAQHSGFHLLLSSARRTDHSLEAAIRSMRGRVDGLVVMSPTLDAGLVERTLPRGFPVVLLNGPPGDPTHDSIVVANFDGAFAVVKHLASLGHRRIAIVRGAEDNYDAAERLRGYRAALTSAGLVHDPALELPGDFSETSGHLAAQSIIGMPNRPTALFAANDGMAIAALSALREAGLRVPQDIAVAGFDDIPTARYLEPALTSVKVDIAALGTRAASRLLEILNGRAEAGPPIHEVMPVTLVVRKSCGA